MKTINVNPIYSCINGIDWKLLRKQKRVLVKESVKYMDDTKKFDAIEGILNLIDAIQDSAVKAGYTQKLIFGR